MYVKCAMEYNWTEQSIKDIKISPTNYFQGGGNFITMPNIRIKIFSDVRIIEFYEVSHTSEDLRTFLQWIQHITKYTKNSRCTGYLFEMDNSIILKMGNSLFPRQSKKPDKVGRFCLDILYLRGRRTLFRNLDFYQPLAAWSTSGLSLTWCFWGHLCPEKLSHLKDNLHLRDHACGMFKGWVVIFLFSWDI